MKEIDKTVISGGLYGLLIGDAVGRPYEFKSPKEIPIYNEIDMLPPKGFNSTYSKVPFGTWTDDGAQALALIDSLLQIRGLDLNHFSQCLCDWLKHGKYTPDGIVFDCGIQTSTALNRIIAGVSVFDAAGRDEYSNGNGALMRVLPVALFERENIETLIEMAMEQCIPTHGHPRSAIVCALYCLMANHLIKENTYINPDLAAEILIEYLSFEQKLELDNILSSPFRDNPTGSGYVVDSLWSVNFAMQQADNFRDVVRNAVALGNDTDTTAAIAGGLAGLKYNYDGIPSDWITQLRGKNQVNLLLDKLFFI
jgi:ADP-ribosyl-[dinitrogen reductase] hydrolase